MTETGGSTLTAGGHELFYTFLNREYMAPGKPLLVFLHEGLGSAAQWMDFPFLLGRNTRLPVLLYDRYGYGKSEPLREPRGRDYLEVEALETLPGIIGNLSIENPLILIGHSDGGTIALLFASRYPDRVAGVITEAPHVFVEEISLAGIRDAVSFFKTGKLKELLARYHGEKTESMFFGWADTWLSFKEIDWNVESYLSGIEAPVLNIQGEYDEYGSEAQIDSIVKKVKGPAEKLIIPQCGHIPHFEERDLVLEKMTLFIKKICPDRD